MPYLAQLAGVHFQPCGYDRLERSIDAALSADQATPLTVGYVNPHVITTAAEHPVIGQHLDACDHVCVDGIGIWLALGLWRRGIERLTAYRATEQLLSRGILRGPTALIGIEPELVDQAGEGLVARNASVQLVGVSHGFSSDAEIADMLDGSGARLILIGAGSPRSEHIAAVARQSIPDAVIFHVGAGTVAHWAGDRSHAPPLLSALGVEWAYRFAKEPHTRERYLHGIPQFIRQTIADPNSVVATHEKPAGHQTVDGERSEPRRKEGVTL